MSFTTSTAKKLRWLQLQMNSPAPLLVSQPSLLHRPENKHKQQILAHVLLGGGGIFTYNPPVPSSSEDSCQNAQTAFFTWKNDKAKKKANFFHFPRLTITYQFLPLISIIYLTFLLSYCVWILTGWVERGLWLDCCLPSQRGPAPLKRCPAWGQAGGEPPTFLFF